MSESSKRDATPKRINPIQNTIDEVKKILPPPGEDWGFYVKGLILGTFFLLWIAIVFAVMHGVGRGGSDSTHELAGSVVIANPANYTNTGEICQGSGEYSVLARDTYVSVARAGKGPLNARLGVGAVNADGACVFNFSVKTSSSDSFIFTIGDLAPISRTLADLNDNTGTDQWATILSWDS
jgi:hypothetical protein